MKVKITILVLIGLLVTLFILMTSYSVKTEDALLSARDSFKVSFKIEGLERNYSTEQVAFHLPKGVQVVDETEYNLMFQQKEQVYLLFFNPIEDQNSKVHYDLDVDFQDEAVLFETIESGGKFGYFIILEEEDHYYKVIIGLGGAKISTITSAYDLEHSTVVMTEILHSLEFAD